MNINKVRTTKSPILGGVELKSATFINKSFPAHFHQNWSLAYIESGSENISFNDFDFVLSNAALILIPPYSVHKNWGGENKIWKYKSIYIHSDVVRRFSSSIKADYSLLENQPYYISYKNNTVFNFTQQEILNALKELFTTANNCSFLPETTKNKYQFDDVINYICHNYDSKITLDHLEKEFKVNKYKLLKSFKKQIGLSPLEYQISLKIEESKRLFFTNTPLSHIAFESGFYDQSHFSHCFKKYVGVSPGKYKNSSSNILQDL